MNSLDQSHRTLLEHFATFRLAERCMADTEAYVKGVLQEILDELGSRYGNSATMDFKEGWLQLNTFPGWHGTTCHFVSLGLENIRVANLLTGTRDKPCRAYIWSAYLNAKQKTPPSEETWPPELRRYPAGFVVSGRSGYLAEKSLEPLSVDQMMRRDEVRRYFRDPLNELSGWLDGNRGAINIMAQQSQLTPSNP